MPKYLDAYLENCLTIICSLGVDNDLQLHTLTLHDALESYRDTVRAINL